jgi:hypothetical protein
MAAPNGLGARSLEPDPSLSVMSHIDLAHADRRPVNGNAEVEFPRLQGKHD